MPKKDWDLFSIYNHIYCRQTETLVIKGIFIIDYIIKFENYNEEIFKFCEHLKLNNNDIDKIKIPHKNKNKNNLNYLNIISLMSEEIKNKIHKMFENDYILLKY